MGQDPATLGPANRTDRAPVHRTQEGSFHRVFLSRQPSNHLIRSRQRNQTLEHAGRLQVHQRVQQPPGLGQPSQVLPQPQVQHQNHLRTLLRISRVGRKAQSLEHQLPNQKHLQTPQRTNQHRRHFTQRQISRHRRKRQNSSFLGRH